MGMFCCPKGHLAMSRDIFGYHNWRRCGEVEVTMTSSGERPRMLLNILQNTALPLQQWIIQSKMSVVLRLRNSDMKQVMKNVKKVSQGEVLGAGREENSLVSRFYVETLVGGAWEFLWKLDCRNIANGRESYPDDGRKADQTQLPLTNCIPVVWPIVEFYFMFIYWIKTGSIKQLRASFLVLFLLPHLSGLI